MKILCIAPLPPPVHGSSMMTKYIKDSTLVNAGLELDWVNLSTSRSMDEIGSKSPVKLLRFASSYVKTLWKLLTRRYDACYLAIACRGMGFLKDAPFVLMCRLFGHRIIIHQHNKGMDAYADRPVYRPLLKAAYKDAKVILLSERLYPDISKIVDKSQIEICPNGIPEMPLLTAPHDSGRPVLLFLSNLMESKGVITALDACRILRDRGYDFECRFVGGETIEIDKSRFIKERHSRGLDGYVAYAGSKYGDDKLREFARADVFVFPTEDDCFPLAVLEALQYSLPVVTTDIGGLPDIVKDGENGLVVPPHSPRLLADAIGRLLDSPEDRINFGKNGYKKYKSQFSLRQFEENVLRCLSTTDKK